MRNFANFTRKVVLSLISHLSKYTDSKYTDSKFDCCIVPTVISCCVIALILSWLIVKMVTALSNVFQEFLIMLKCTEPDWDNVNYRYELYFDN